MKPAPIQQMKQFDSIKFPGTLPHWWRKEQLEAQHNWDPRHHKGHHCARKLAAITQFVVPSWLLRLAASAVVYLLFWTAAAICMGIRPELWNWSKMFHESFLEWIPSWNSEFLHRAIASTCRSGHLQTLWVENWCMFHSRYPFEPENRNGVTLIAYWNGTSSMELWPPCWAHSQYTQRNKINK